MLSDAVVLDAQSLEWVRRGDVGAAVCAHTAVPWRLGRSGAALLFGGFGGAALRGNDTVTVDGTTLKTITKGVSSEDAAFAPEPRFAHSSCLLPGGGMRLKCELTDKSHKEFMAGWNGTTNTNYDTLPELWEWKAPKVTSRLNGRFQYGYVEVRLKAPKGYGPWPAAWLNGCYGFVAESTGEFLLQDDYPFLCGQFWPPELDFFEHFSPEHTWWWRPNSQSVHSPNQCAAAAARPATERLRTCRAAPIADVPPLASGTWASGATRRRRAGTARRRSPVRARRGASG